MFQLRFLHLVNELSGIGTEAFYITTLTFGVDGIHGQRAFPTTAGATKYRHFFPGNFRVHQFQVVLLGTPHSNHLC